jgi:hypothetical protein
MKQQKPGMANAAKALGPQDRAVIKKLMQEAAIKDDYISELRAEGDAIEAELATCIEGLDEVWEALQEEQKRGHALEKTLRCCTTHHPLQMLYSACRRFAHCQLFVLVTCTFLCVSHALPRYVTPP